MYTLESRIALAGWAQANIDNYNGPTPEVVSGLAENVRKKLGSTYCVCEVRWVAISLAVVVGCRSDVRATVADRSHEIHNADGDRAGRPARRVERGETAHRELP